MIYKDGHGIIKILKMNIFIVCLYDYCCDKEFMIEVLSVCSTLENAVQYCSSKRVINDQYIEIIEFHDNIKTATYSKEGNQIHKV